MDREDLLQQKKYWFEYAVLNECFKIGKHANIKDLHKKYKPVLKKQAFKLLTRYS